MDGEWYVNRQATRRMTIAELQRGPGSDRPPSTDRAVAGPHRQAVRRESRAARRRRQERSLSAALRPARLRRARDRRPDGGVALPLRPRLLTSPRTTSCVSTARSSSRMRDGQAVSSAGKPRAARRRGHRRVPRKMCRAGPGGTYRAVATRLPGDREGAARPVSGVGHAKRRPERHRAARTSARPSRPFVFAAWLNISNFRAVGTQDILTTIDGVPRIRHFLVDFTRSLGSGPFDGPKLGWEGNETSSPGSGRSAATSLTLGLATPAWMKETVPGSAGSGRVRQHGLRSRALDDRDPIPPFVNRLPDDAFWAARQVMAFTDDEIRAVVRTGQYSQPAEGWITATLIERRNRIGRAFFSRVLPLDHFRVAGGALVFDDLAVTYGFSTPRTYTIEWSGFDNATDKLTAEHGRGAAAAGGGTAARRRLVHRGARARRRPARCTSRCSCDDRPTASPWLASSERGRAK